jgi:hypothetical protein
MRCNCRRDSLFLNLWKSWPSVSSEGTPSQRRSFNNSTIRRAHRLSARPGKYAKGLLRYDGRAYIPAIKSFKKSWERTMTTLKEDTSGSRAPWMQFAASTFGIVWRRALGNTSRPATYCQRVAVHRHKEHGMLKPLPQPKRPFETITLDFITGLPPSKW